jgi:hypothetical protein
MSFNFSNSLKYNIPQNQNIQLEIPNKQLENNLNDNNLINSEDFLIKLKSDYLQLSKEILANSTKKEMIPRYSIKQNFFQAHQYNLDEKIKNINNNFDGNLSIPLMQHYQELRLSKIFYFLKEANEKYKNLSNFPNLSGNCTSQLLIVYDIIKNSHELITLIYLLQWLESIYLKESFRRDIERKFIFSEDLTGKENKDFNLDVFNSSDLLKKMSTLPLEDDIKEYDRIFERIVLKVRAGNLAEAQKFATYNNLHNISCSLSGGLPINDFLFDSIENFVNVDFDIFPNYMRNEAFHDLRNKTEAMNLNKNSVIINNTNSRKSLNEDSFIGNPNWINWIYSNYNLSYQIQETDSKINEINLGRTLSSFLSGNSQIFENITNFNNYDYLYTKFLNLFNYKLIKEYLDIEKIDIHFTENLVLSNFLEANKDITINKIISEFRQIEGFQHSNFASNFDFLFDLELDIILLQSILIEENNKILNSDIENNNNKFFDVFIQMNSKKNHYYQSENLKVFLKNQFIANQKDKFGYENNYILEQDLTHQIKFGHLNYLKIGFLFELGILMLFKKILIFEENLNINKKYYNKEEIKRYNNNKIKDFFNLTGDFFLKLVATFKENKEILSISKIAVYICGFFFDIDDVKKKLIEHVKSISNKEEFEYLIQEIDLHFEPYSEIINKCLASKSTIYPTVIFNQ